MQGKIVTQAPAIEFADKKQTDIFQFERLKSMLNYISEKSEYYKTVFSQGHIDINLINSLADLKRLPFTTKDDLASRNNDFLCVPKDSIAEYVTTSGTLGAPVAFYLTHNDIDRLGYNEAISMICAGASSNDVFQLMTTMDRAFIAGLAYWQGAQRLGAGMIRIGPGNLLSQWDAIQKFMPTVLIAIPSFIPSLLSFASKYNIDYASTSVRKILCIGESIRNENLELNELGKKIISRWNVELYSTYASTEMCSAFTECSARRGGHLHPELLIVEVLDEAGQPVSEGGKGEVVITTLGIEGMPLLRYRTGDICNAYYNRCSCGRTSMRLGPVLGRKQQMLKIKGTTFFPTAVFDILDKSNNISDYVVKVIKDSLGNDEVIICLPLSVRSENMENELKSRMQSMIRVNIPIEFLADELLFSMKFNPDKRKPIKFLDLRVF